MKMCTGIATQTWEAIKEGELQNNSNNTAVKMKRNGTKNAVYGQN